MANPTKRTKKRRAIQANAAVHLLKLVGLLFAVRLQLTNRDPRVSARVAYSTKRIKNEIRSALKNA
jgi:hypothetical protein